MNQQSVILKEATHHLNGKFYKRYGYGWAKWDGRADFVLSGSTLYLEYAE